MLSNQYGSAIGIFSSREEAGQALDYIVFSGFPIAKVFLLGEDWIDTKGRDSTWMQNLVADARAGVVTGTPKELKLGLGFGFASGSAVGLLLGWVILALPGVVESMRAPAFPFLFLVAAIFAAIGGVAGSLMGIVVATQRAKEVARRVAKGELLLVVEGTDAEASCAERLLDAQLPPDSFLK